MECCGIPQGTILGQLLFLSNANDMLMSILFQFYRFFYKCFASLETTYNNNYVSNASSKLLVLKFLGATLKS